MPDSHPHRVETPTILLTCGDPAGIGPEIVASAWAATAAHTRSRLRVVAPAGVLERALAVRGQSHPRPSSTWPTGGNAEGFHGRQSSHPAAADLFHSLLGGGSGPAPRRILPVAPDDPRGSTPDEVLVIEPAGAATLPLPRPGAATAAGGRLAIAAVETACGIVRAGRAAALVTGPLHKGAIHAAGLDVPGHTELLARACGLPDDAASMMLWLPGADGGGLGVVHATLHESLATAVARLSTPGIVAAGRRLAGLLEPLLGRRPRIAVAALNPHGGEGGLFGDEEPRLVAPAVRELVAAGLDAAGPLPADTLFLRASRGEFDGIVALYHDQGHIPVKLLGMHRAVNITLGLPLVRTSVAHGTAFDIVGTGRADPTSMLAAIDAAVRLVEAGWPAGRAVTAARA